MIYLPLIRLKIENNNERLLQLIRKSDAELKVITNSYESLIKYHQSLLEVVREVGDKAEEGRSYGNLGFAYQGLGQFKTAIKYHQRSLEIAKEVGDKAEEGRSYGNLGNAY